VCIEYTCSHFSYTLGIIAVSEQEDVFNGIPVTSNPAVSKTTVMESLKNRAEMGFDLFQDG